ncbi:hypothetical protein CYMTET_23543, partial [Cymbomonas tetramitiformis]
MAIVPPNLLPHVDKYLRTHRWSEALHSKGRQGDLVLTPNELHNILHACLPEGAVLYRRETRIFQALVDLQSSGHISKKVLESSVSIAQDIRTQVICAASPAHSKEAVSWQDVLVMVAQRVEDHKDSLESTAKLWQEKTGSQEDGIDALGVKAILKELVPQLPKEELKYLITHIYLVGLDRDGLLTLEEIATCLKSRVKTEELHEEPSWDANPPCIASATKCFRALMEGPAGAQPPPIQELASQSSFFDAPRGSVCSTAFTSATTATVASSATCG